MLILHGPSALEGVSYFLQVLACNLGDGDISCGAKSVFSKTGLHQAEEDDGRRPSQRELHSADMGEAGGVGRSNAGWPTAPPQEARDRALLPRAESCK